MIYINDTTECVTRHEESNGYFVERASLSVDIEPDPGYLWPGASSFDRHPMAHPSNRLYTDTRATDASSHETMGTGFPGGTEAPQFGPPKGMLSW